MSHSQSLIRELESSLSKGSSEQRSDILKRLTALFLANADAYTEEHVGVFDDVMSRLIEKIEKEALVELSGKLAPVARSPLNIAQQLSRSDDISISGPMLEKSTRLSDNFLVEIANTKSQAHLAAIAGRVTVAEAVTDVLADRGDDTVARKVTANSGARFSPFGFNMIADRARQDEQLAVEFSRRTDVPPAVFDELVRKATAAVRQKLMVNADTATRERIASALSAASRTVARSEAPSAPRPANGTARVPIKDDERIKIQLMKYAKAGDAAATVDTLAILSGVPGSSIRSLVQQGAEEGLLVLGRAAELGWPDMQDILQATMRAKIATPADSRAMFDKFIELSEENAQRALRFIKMSKSVTGGDVRKLM